MTEYAQAPAVWSSAKIVEFDFAGIEQVVMGWLFQSPRYIRTAKLGTHAIVASHILAKEKGSSWQPADLSWPDDQLTAYLASIKKAKDPAVSEKYDQSKRCVHGTAYGLTTHGMMRNYPKTFPTVKAADDVQKAYFALAPEVPRFHTVVRHTAYGSHHLGGGAAYEYHPDQLKVTGHPYGYRHWFWSVVGYQRLTEAQRLWRVKRKMDVLDINGIPYGVTLGEDAKRAVAFYPQSTARGILTEACFPLFDPEDPLADYCYVGDLYYGATPLRAPIHDSLLFECPTRMVDRLTERVAYAMLRPILAMPCPLDWGMGPALQVGVDAKIGPDWGAMTSHPVPSWFELTGETWGQPAGEAAGDVSYFPAEPAEEDDVSELETEVRLAGVA